MKRKKLIVANWKMAPDTTKDAKRVFSSIKKVAGTLRNVQTVVCPPFVYIDTLRSAARGHRCVVGAQDLFWESGDEAHTGEVSPVMLRALGVSYVIVGHSERRALGESNEIVSKKAVAGVSEGMQVILCVGEGERDEMGSYTAFLKEQLLDSLQGITKKTIASVIVAYEPIWAIGKNAKRAASPEDALEAAIFIRKVLSDAYGKAAQSVPVLYGGSVNETNAQSFLAHEEIDGLLVGRASLDPARFNTILRTANEI